jgi:hypothetical protein
VHFGERGGFHDADSLEGFLAVGWLDALQAHDVHQGRVVEPDRPTRPDPPLRANCLEQLDVWPVLRPDQHKVLICEVGLCQTERGELGGVRFLSVQRPTRRL